MFIQLTNPSKAIIGFIAESKKKDIKYYEIKKNIGSEISNYLIELVDKGALVKKERGKYSIKDNMFREYLRTFKPYKRI